MWYRVFGTGEAEVDPAVVLEHLQRQGFEVSGHFRGDDQGWFHADIRHGGDDVIEVERYLSSEEGIRAQLNTWAAWLEALPDSPQQLPLMQHMICTRQLFTLNAAADDDAADQICLALCRYLAGAAQGIYQIDGRGMFDAQDKLLVSEQENI